MKPITDIHLVSTAIRDAVAPVFLLTGVGSILSVLVGRLGRAIDCARLIHDWPLDKRQQHKEELLITISRIKWLCQHPPFSGMLN